MKKKISILGSTGSIGRQALEVVDRMPDNFEIYALAAAHNIELISEQIRKYNPEVVSMDDKDAALALEKEFPGLTVLCGNDGLVEIAQNAINDIVLVSVTGLNGLFPTLAAINSNVDVALANKETLVAAGDIVNERLKKSKAKLLPVDSEHSAIHQCIKDISMVRKLLITASGGPFRDKSLEDMKNASVEQTLNHPKWHMGNKITVDSATLMNKGLEVIEAHHLFGVDYDDIEVVIHPQSVIHSAVEYNDGSVIAQMGIPSMHIPIQYALTYPERSEGIKTDSFDFYKIGQLTFEKPDFKKFRCLELAYHSGKEGGTNPVVLNAANEVAVYAYLEKKIPLYRIWEIVEDALSKHKTLRNPSLADIIEVDKHTRDYVKSLIKQDKRFEPANI